MKASTLIALTLMVATLPGAALAAATETRSPPGDNTAIEEPHRELGEHPAVLVQRNWGQRGYDYASKFYPHPAWLALLPEAPRELNEHPAVLVARKWSGRGQDQASQPPVHPALNGMTSASAAAPPRAPGQAATAGPSVAARQNPGSNLVP